MPGTTASLEQRLHIISGIVTRHPAVGWKLLLALLPHVSESIGRHITPEWNFWAENWTPWVVPSDQEKTLTELIKMVIAVVEIQPDRWIDFLKGFDFLPHGEQQIVLSEFEALDVTALSEPQKQGLWDFLRAKISRYRSYPNARLIPSPEIISRFELLQDKLKPTNVLELVAPSFSNGFGMFGNPNLPWEEQEKLRQKNRADCLNQVLAVYGLDGVIELISKSQDAWGIGITLSEIVSNRFEGEIIPSLLTTDDKKKALFASGYLMGLINHKGRDWAESRVSPEWSPEATAGFTVCLAFDPRTWAFVDLLGESKAGAYWETVRAHPNGLNPSEVEQAARRLTQAQRSPSAISLLASSTYLKNAPEPNVLLDLFEAALFAPASDNAERLEDAHDMHAILEAIYAGNNIDESRLTKIEWNLLPILNRHTLLPHGLHRLLAREPKFFVELLTSLFRSENEPEREENAESLVDNADSQKRQNAWHLLHDFGTIPGADDEGKVHLEKLRKWVLKTRELAQAEERLGVCDSAIGQLLAHSGDGEDESWPIIPVREVIEEIASDRLDNGFFVGTINRRGPSWRAITEGGNPTRNLAAQWQKHAVACKVKWPRTASAIAAVAERYRIEAVAEDEDAERQR